MLEYRPIPVPADSGADAIVYQQDLLERVCVKPGKFGGAGPERLDPCGDGLAAREAPGLEIIGPAERARQPFALPLLKLEWREPCRLDLPDGV